MQTNDPTNSTDESGTSKSAESDAKPNGLVKTVLDAVLEGKDAVVVPVKADSSAKNQEEKVHEQNDEAAPENPDK